MGMEGRGWQEAASTPPCPAWNPCSPGLSFPALQGSGWGQELSPQTHEQSSGLGDTVLEGSTHCTPAPGQGCPITWEVWGLLPMGHSHLGRGVPAWRGVAGGTRERMSEKRSAQGTKACGSSQQLGEGGTGPMGPPPCSDTHLGTVSPPKPHTHVEKTSPFSH